MQIFKTKILYTIVACIILIPGCKKTSAQNEVTSKSSVQASSSVQAVSNPWGVVINSSAADPSGAADPLLQQIISPANKIQLALDYGVKYIRTSITKDDWDASKTGFLYTYDNFVRNGFTILLNIIWHDPGTSGGQFVPVPFANDATNPSSLYYKYVKSVIDTLTSNGHTPPGVVVVENEETNKNYHVIDDSTDYQKYILMLQATATICHAKGIKVTNGGLTLRGLTYATWDWLKNVKKQTVDAQTFANNSMPLSAYYTLYPPKPANIKTVGTVNINSQVAMVNYFVAHYNSLPLDYVNFHWYEPANVRGWVDSINGGTPWSHGYSKNDTAAGALDNVLLYLKRNVLSKKIISNEIGQVTQSDCLTRKIMKKIASRPYNAFEIACWYDGDGDDDYDAKAMHNSFLLGPFFNMRSTGITFQRLVGDPVASPSCSPLK